MTDNWRQQPPWQGPNAAPPPAGPPQSAGQQLPSHQPPAQPPNYRPGGQQPPNYQHPGGYQPQGPPVAPGQGNPPARYSAATPTHGYPALKPPPPQAWSQAPAPTGRLAPIPGRSPGQGGLQGSGFGGPQGSGFGGPPMQNPPGRPRFGPQGPFQGPPQGPRRRRSAALWIAGSAVIVVVAVAALVIVLTHRNSGDQAGPTPTSPTDGVGTIRAYPSITLSANAADGAQQQKAQQVGEAWVKAVNASDRDTAVTYMCAKNQSVTENNLFTGIQPGSLKAGQVAVNGKKGTLPLTLNTTDGKSTSASLPMTLESDDWKVCLTQ
ncbi:MAG: hypothetical protein ACR2P2_22115 [Nakamurella sp.]